MQVRLTDALVSSLDFKKGKDAELAWLDAQIAPREVEKDLRPPEEDEDGEERTGV